MMETKSESRLQYYRNKGGFEACTAGSARIVINDREYILTRGSVFVVTPLVQISLFEPDEDYRCVSFVSILKVFFPIFQLIADTGVPLKVREYPCWQLSEDELKYVISQEERIRKKKKRMREDILPDERSLLAHQINLILHETMLEVVGNHIGSYQTQVDDIDKQKVLAYRFILSVHEHYTTERRVAWYAAQAHMSPGHFTSIIKGATGLTPSEWIATVTTSYAKMMLEQGDRTIKEIAAELNFPEQFTFRKYFKQHTGVSPKEYRNSVVRLEQIP